MELLVKIQLNSLDHFYLGQLRLANRAAHVHLSFHPYPTSGLS